MEFAFWRLEKGWKGSHPARSVDPGPAHSRVVMKPTLRRLLLFVVALLFASHVLLVSAPPARAQFFDESLEQEELFTEDENAFFEDRTFGTEDTGGASQEQDFTEGNRFVDEQLIPADQRALTQGGRRLQLTLGKERDTLPLNIAWGAGTGLLIGGWFALIGEGDNRQTQRSIGLGIVTGILLGVAVGTRTVFNPDAPRPVGQTPPAKDGPQFSPVVALDKGDSRVGFRMTF